MTALKGSAAAFFTYLFFPLLSACKSNNAVQPREIVVASTEELKPGTSKFFRFQGRQGILLRTMNGEYKALSADCTHVECTVRYRPDAGDLWCSCHNGRFALSGEILSGPMPRHLEAFRIAVEDGKIIIS